MEAKHVQLRHQLNDTLDIEQAYTCYLSPGEIYPKDVLISAWKASLIPLTEQHHELYPGRGKGVIVHKDYSYPCLS